FRWSQIFDAGKFTAKTTVMKARQSGNSVTSPFAPAPIEEVTAAIREARPAAVFAPHVETSAGMIF
ncbi:MAG TPA: aminotransferase, partial [Rhodobacteraceae bacterium]|nr:aminotransferase [Paracoccaceae bacterium]